MIDIKIEGWKKKVWVPTVVGSPVKVEETNTEAFGISKSIFWEANRRDAIVKRLARECSYGVGDTVACADPKDEEENGKQLIVLSIADSYVKLGKDESWPKTDNPLIVHVKSHDKGTTFFCTTNYVVKKGSV